MIAHDAADGVEAEAGSFADWLGGEEWLEDAAFDIVRDAGAVVDYFDAGTVAVAGGAYGELAVSIHGVGGVGDQVGPDLVELAAVRADFGQGAVVLADDLDAVFQAMAQHHQSVFQTRVDVDFLLGHLVHVGVLFDGADKLGNTPCAVFNFVRQAADSEGGSEADQHVIQELRGDVPRYVFQRVLRAAEIDQSSGEIPGGFNAVLLQPSGDFVFAVASFQGVQYCLRTGVLRPIAFQPGEKDSRVLGKALLIQFQSGSADRG